MDYTQHHIPKRPARLRQGKYQPSKVIYRMKWNSPEFIKPGENPTTHRANLELVDYYEIREHIESDIGKVESSFLSYEEEELLDWDRRFNDALKRNKLY